jgi:hypothetical protein
MIKESIFHAVEIHSLIVFLFQRNATKYSLVN